MKQSLCSLVCLCALLACATMALAAYPERGITLVAPFSSGGASDLAGRAFAQIAQKYVPQPIMVVNRDGAGGIVGSQWVRKQRPDGYTLLVSRIGPQAMVPALNSKSPYRWDQFTFLGLLQIDPVIFVTRPDAPYATLQALVDTIRTAPGTISYSTSGIFTTLTVASRLLLNESGLAPTRDAKMVPFKGGGAAMTALLGGHVDFLACNLGEAKAQVDGKVLRPLAITSHQGFAELADVPLLSALGYTSLDALSGWTGLCGPESLPEEVVGYWADVIFKVTHDPEWLRIIHELGCIPQHKEPAAFKAFVQQQYDFFLNIKPIMQE